MCEAGGPPTGHGLYIHVPFCASICPYCDFAVLKGDAGRRSRFVESLLAEISLAADWAGSFDTIYFGGGTPSLLEADQLEEILTAAGERLAIDESATVSLEVNPEDVDDRSLAAWRGLGIEMLSLGIQSFDKGELAFLGRAHDPETAVRAVELAMAAGFPVVSLDLIYGLPGQSLESWRRQLEVATSLAPQHISCYQLTVHEKTVFGVWRRRGRLTELGDDLQADFFFEAHRRLALAGYEGYEVSNFASAPEHRSRHNYKYWSHTPYLGLGPSAHSFDGESRWWNERKEGPWSRAIGEGRRPVAGRERLSRRDLAFERLMLGLRTADGVDLGEIDRCYGTSMSQANGRLVDELCRQGKLERTGTRLRPTLAGLATADAMALAFETSPTD